MRPYVWISATVVLILIGVAAFLYSPPPKEVTTTTTATPQVTETTVTRQAVVGTSPAPAEEKPRVSISYNSELAERGAQLFKDLACTACHTVRSAGITVGGNIGPDLSRVLLGNVGVEKGSAGGPIMMEYFRKHGLNDPASDPEKAAQLIAEFLSKGDEDLAPTMSAQIEQFRKQYGDRWTSEIIPALVELFKMAAAK